MCKMLENKTLYFPIVYIRIGDDPHSVKIKSGISSI